jgi:DNA-binding CsgD family transcriptional regulator
MAVRRAWTGHTSPLVGRTTEQEAIEAAVRDAVSGQPSLVWVEGDPGFGKTALVRDALGRMPAAMQVHQAHADELATDVPFELAGRLGSSVTDSSFAAGLQLLEAWARHQDEGPVAVVVEDLHWADAASSKALLCAAQRLDEDKVVLIVTTRPGVRDGWERMQTDSARCRRIVLSALTASDVGAMAAAQGIDLTPDQAERLHRHTAGHPLYVRTLLTELSPAELRVADGDLPAPSSLTSAVTAGLSVVREPARRLAAAMAVVNQRAGLVEIGRVAGVAAPIEPFEELLGTGFVQWEPDEPGTPVEFVHPLYRQAIYRDLSPRARRDLHRSAVAVAAPEAALAHRVAAADGTDDVLADELARSARRDEEGGSAAVAARNLLWSSSLSTDPAKVEERLLAAARLYVNSGQTPRASALRARIEACPASPERDLLLGLIFWDQGHAAEAKGWLENVVDPNRQPATDPGTAARAWAELAEVLVIEGHAQEALDAAEQARSLAAPGSSADRLASIHLSLATALLEGGPAGLERLRQRLPDPPENVPAAEADVLVTRATLSLYSGHTQDALADLRAVVALSRRGSSPVLIARCHFEMATSLQSTGAWDDALLHARIGLGIASDEGQASMQSQCHAVLGTINAYRGEWAAAEGAIAAAGEEAALRGDIEATATAMIAAAALAEARHEPARVIDALHVLPGAVSMLARLAFWPALVTACIDDGQLDRADELITDLVEAAAARRLRMEPRVLGLRARLAAARQRFGEAIELFDEAQRGYGPDDPVLERARLVHANGLALLRQGNRQRAVSLLHEAGVALASLGAAPFLARLDADRAAAGVDVAESSRPAKSPLDLTDRERDVAVLVAKGLTNPEVAEELYVSRKAVEYHLGNIFGKLGITSRRALRGRTF